MLPKFGIEREVRVCDSCFDQYGPKEEEGGSPVHEKVSSVHVKTGLGEWFCRQKLKKTAQIVYLRNIWLVLSQNSHRSLSPNRFKSLHPNLNTPTVVKYNL